MDHQRNRRPSGDSALVGGDRWLQPPRTLRATRAGWCFVAIIFGVGFAALNTGNNLLYLVLALMLSFLVLSGLLSESSLRGIQIDRSLPRELFARSPNRVVLTIHNSLRKNASFAITVEDQTRFHESVDPAGRVFALRVGAQETVERSYHFEPKQRGDVHFSGFRVSTRFPFGLFVKSRQLVLAQDAVVYPEVSRVPINRATSSESAEHEREASTSRDGDEISGLREFAVGDAQRRIHWRSSLRAGRLLVGEREGIADAEIEIQLDLPPSATESLIEERIAYAASEIVTHLDAGIRVGLCATAARFDAAKGHAHRADLLTFLAHVHFEARPGPRPGMSS